MNMHVLQRFTLQRFQWNKGFITFKKLHYWWHFLIRKKCLIIFRTKLFFFLRNFGEEKENVVSAALGLKVILISVMCCLMIWPKPFSSQVSAYWHGVMYLLCLIQTCKIPFWRQHAKPSLNYSRPFGVHGWQAKASSLSWKVYICTSGQGTKYLTFAQV